MAAIIFHINLLDAFEIFASFKYWLLTSPRAMQARSRELDNQQARFLRTLKLKMYVLGDKTKQGTRLRSSTCEWPL